MKLIIGLGNPGKGYEHNRHNVGHWFIQEVGDEEEGVNFKVFKTDTFMNDSGRFVKSKMDFYKISPADLVIVHDDLDLKIGEHKIQFGVGPKVHNGVNSIEQAIKTKDFWRVRIGTDGRDPENRTMGQEYVLDDFSKEEQQLVEKQFGEMWNELKRVLA